MNFKRFYIDVGDAKLFCTRGGSGAPVALVNGGPGMTHLDLLPFFSKKLEGAEIIAYDQRGCGKSDKDPQRHYSLEQAVDDLDKIRAHLGFKKWCVLGHSYGGLLARLYAEKYPQHVLGLVLVSTINDGLFYETKTERKRNGRHLKEAFSLKEKAEYYRVSFSEVAHSLPRRSFSLLTSGFVKKSLLSLKNCWERSSSQILRSISDTKFVLIGRLCDAALRESVIQDRKSMLHNRERTFNNLADTPVLLVEGKYDLEYGGEERAKMKMAHFKNAHLIMLEKSRHCPFKTEPKSFFRLLNEFVSSMNDEPSRQAHPQTSATAVPVILPN